MKTKTGLEIELSYNDKDSHGFVFATKGSYCNFDLTKQELNELVMEIIKYTQGNPDFKEE